MNCNLRVQAGPEIKGEVTSPSWENREMFAASREKNFQTEDTQQKHGYIISSYEPLAELFFLYFNIRPNNNKTKINNQKNAARKFFDRLPKSRTYASTDISFVQAYAHGGRSLLSK